MKILKFFFQITQHSVKRKVNELITKVFGRRVDVKNVSIFFSFAYFGLSSGARSE